MIKSILKQILRATNLYYPLQGTYVRIIANLRRRNLKKKFEPFKGSGFTCNFCGSSYSKFESWDPPGADAEALARNK
ncbi:MAG: hypothetical protein H7Y27_04050, partial [Gemmatimonadaceae bacterium]|nr:hypothetical protein [Chitinophagaceae bacterium]